METYVQPHIKKSLENHKLQRVLKEGNYEVWVMKRPGTRHYAAQITFSPGGIAIQGDCRFDNDRGAIGDPGYNLEWFGGKPLTETYLCEKFFHEEYVPETIAELLEEELEHPEDHGLEGHEDVVKGVIASLRSHEMDERQLVDSLQDIGYDTFELPHDYNLNAASMLCAIQQRFCELYNEQKPAQEAPAIQL